MNVNILWKCKECICNYKDHLEHVIIRVYFVIIGLQACLLHCTSKYKQKGIMWVVCVPPTRLVKLFTDDAQIIFWYNGNSWCINDNVLLLHLTFNDRFFFYLAMWNDFQNFEVYSKQSNGWFVIISHSKHSSFISTICTICNLIGFEPHICYQFLQRLGWWGRCLFWYLLASSLSSATLPSPSSI
jgi:hypothetical protein